MFEVSGLLMSHLAYTELSPADCELVNMLCMSQLQTKFVPWQIDKLELSHWCSKSENLCVLKPMHWCTPYNLPETYNTWHGILCQGQWFHSCFWVGRFCFLGFLQISSLRAGRLNAVIIWTSIPLLSPRYHFTMCAKEASVASVGNLPSVVYMPGAYITSYLIASSVSASEVCAHVWFILL